MPKFRFAGLLVALLLGLAPLAQAQSFQEGVNRPGPAYSTLTAPSARRCQKACVDDGQCRAWVFINVTLADNCQLKSEKPPAVVDQCCTTGVVN